MRYYNPLNGNFTTEDTYIGIKENPLTRNRYDYAGTTNRNSKSAKNTGGKKTTFRTKIAQKLEKVKETVKRELCSDDREKLKIVAEFGRNYHLMVTNPNFYVTQKAQEYAKTVKKGSTKSPVSGEAEGVIRYKKNGKYIDLASDGTIISFGKQ